MKYKPLLIYLFISSIFLTLIGSIWKIMATLQGLKFTEINFNVNFLLALLLNSQIKGRKFFRYTKSNGCTA